MLSKAQKKLIKAKAILAEKAGKDGDYCADKNMYAWQEEQHGKS